MEIFAVFAILLLVVYGLLSASAALSQGRKGVIPGWSASGMVAAALGLWAAGYFLGERSWLTLPVLLVSLGALHAFAAVNGLHIHGKLNWSHHAARLLISIVLVVLTYLAL